MDKAKCKKFIKMNILLILILLNLIKQFLFRGAVSLTRQILRNEGIPGLFRGLSSTMAREMPGYFFFFGGYELTKSILSDKNNPQDNIGLVKTIIAGGFGGMALWVSIFPFDVVKSRIQVESSKERMHVVLVQVFKQQGIRGLYNVSNNAILVKLDFIQVKFYSS